MNQSVEVLALCHAYLGLLGLVLCDDKHQRPWPNLQEFLT